MNTVYVIGAGASKEVGLPLGYQLKSEISSLLDFGFDLNQLIKGDHTIYHSLNQYLSDNDSSENINDYLEEARYISQSLPLAISIDNLIENNKGNKKIELISKLAIIRAILKGESGSSLYLPGRNMYEEINFNSLGSVWYSSFFQLLTEGCSRSELVTRFENISIISFNYDRCIEHYLFNALKKYYRLEFDETAAIIDSLKIYHPYGSVGVLPELQMNLPSSGDQVKFGSQANHKFLLRAAQNIKTFTEGTDSESSNILNIKNCMSEAERLVFLGFAFHKLNMELITPNDVLPISCNRKCYATTHGLSSEDVLILKEEIKSMYFNQIEVNTSDLKCSGFFGDFWKSLSY